MPRRDRRSRGPYSFLTRRGPFGLLFYTTPKDFSFLSAGAWRLEPGQRIQDYET